MWADFTLLVGLLSKIWKLETFNYETGYGAKGLLEALNLNPQFGLFRFYAGYLSSMTEIWWDVAMWDGILCIFIVLLMGLVTLPAEQTISNIKNQTSEVIKLKKKNQKLFIAQEAGRKNVTLPKKLPHNKAYTCDFNCEQKYNIQYKLEGSCASNTPFR